MAEIGQRAAARLIALDPRLPSGVEQTVPAADAATTPDSAPGCDAVFTATAPPGELPAMAWCEHRFHEPESPSLTWSSARQFGLRLVLPGPEITAPLDDLLSQWRDHLAGVAEANEEDSAASIRWPSRDIEGVLALQRHGLIPQTVTGVRITSSKDRGASPSAPKGISIRRAEPADTDLVAELSLALVRYEAHFGSLHVRPWTEAAMHNEAAELLAQPDPWAWLAERDGKPVGMLTALRPTAAAWIAPQVRLAPVAYLGEMFVRSTERGSGVAGLLTSQFNAAAAAAGVAVTLLHYGQVNPLSGPFWSRQGYRPLWTTWEARPARTLR